MPCLEVRRIDILQDVIEEGWLRLRRRPCSAPPSPACPQRLGAYGRRVKPGGVLLSIEPDMLPCTVTEPDAMRAFWQGWLKWSVEAGIDYFIGRKIPAWLDSLGLVEVAGEGHTAQFNGGSRWATYWTSTMRELAPALLKSGHVTGKMLQEFHSFYQDPHYWTSIMTFVENWGRKPA